MLAAELFGISKPADIEARWRRLEAVTPCSVFTSWTWVSAWLTRALQSHAVLAACVREGADTVALGLFVRSWGIERGVLVRRLHLHAVGRSEEDQVHVEFNGLLCDPRSLERVWPVLLAALENGSGSTWDQLEIPGAMECRQYENAAKSIAALVTSSAVPAPYVDLEPLRANSLRFVDVLSRKTRYDIRRAQSEYERAFGPAVLSVAVSEQQALEWLDELARLNERRQASLGARSSFSNPYFREFHRRIVRAGCAAHQAILLRATAGSVVVGYLYVLTDTRAAYLYQSGYDYDLLDGAGMPGYLCLPLAIEHFRVTERRYFEFLGGQELYKRKLSNGERTMHHVRLRRRTLPMRMVRLVESLAQKLRRP
jgi:CelD/BcsL family acetyltransferase involved in cellulose biosynthesis